MGGRAGRREGWMRGMARPRNDRLERKRRPGTGPAAASREHTMVRHRGLLPWIMVTLIIKVNVTMRRRQERRQPARLALSLAGAIA